MLLGLQTVRNFAFGPVRIRSYYPQVTSQVDQVEIKVDQYRNGMDIYGPYTDSSIYGPGSRKFSPALTVISQSLFEPVDFWYFKHPCNIFYVFIIFLVGKVSVIVIVKQNYEWAIWRREEALLFGIIRYGFDSFSTRFTRRVVCFYFNFPVGDTWPAFPSIQKRKNHS